MPYANPDARLAFLAHPRAASHSVARALQDQAGFVPVGTHHAGRDVVADRWPESANWTFFCVVRNPYDALVSWWYKRGKGEGFELRPRWLETLERQLSVERPEGDVHLMAPGRLWLMADECDVVLRFEHLTADLTELLDAHGLPVVNLPWDVRSNRGGVPYWEEYDTATRDWVTTRYATELWTWGYAWEAPATV
jgi:hypothetical protein